MNVFSIAIFSSLSSHLCLYHHHDFCFCHAVSPSLSLVHDHSLGQLSPFLSVEPFLCPSPISPSNEREERVIMTRSSQRWPEQPNAERRRKRKRKHCCCALPSLHSDNDTETAECTLLLLWVKWFNRRTYAENGMQLRCTKMTIHLPFSRDASCQSKESVFFHVHQRLSSPLRYDTMPH